MVPASGGFHTLVYSNKHKVRWIFLHACGRDSKRHSVVGANNSKHDAPERDVKMRKYFTWGRVAPVLPARSRDCAEKTPHPITYFHSGGSAEQTVAHPTHNRVANPRQIYPKDTLYPRCTIYVETVIYWDRFQHRRDAMRHRLSPFNWPCGNIFKPSICTLNILFCNNRGCGQSLWKNSTPNPMKLFLSCIQFHYFPCCFGWRS